MKRPFQKWEGFFLNPVVYLSIYSYLYSMSDSIKKYHELVESGQIVPGEDSISAAPMIVEAVVAIAREYPDAPASLIYTMALNSIKSGKITATK